MNATDSETSTVSSKTVACDGGTLGHPRVFLTMDEDGQVICPYCSHTYVLDADADQDSGH